MHKDWSNTYKFLHWIFAPLIALQLLLSLFMSSKKQGLPYLLFNIHITIGPILAGVIIALWIYILTNNSIR
ncbi:cytochrome b/b6 domain-containing protein, partial [Hydrogenobaculum sp.]